MELVTAEPSILCCWKDPRYFHLPEEVASLKSCSSSFSTSPAPFVLAPRHTHVFAFVSTCQCFMSFGSYSCSSLYVKYPVLLTFIKIRPSPHSLCWFPLQPPMCFHSLPWFDFVFFPMGSSRMGALPNSSCRNSKFVESN